MEGLLNIMRKLRGPKGCLWDRKQTISSLKWCLLEEAYEVINAIDSRSPEKLKEELGDLLCIIAMLITMGEEKKLFDNESILRAAQAKMKRRHPHVFGRKKARSAEEAYSFWRREKLKELQKQKGSLLNGLSLNYPALMAASKLQRRVAKVGFDWPGWEPVMEKIGEELRELKKEIKKRSNRKKQEEIGDLLFALVNLARKLGIDAETTLLETNKKFRKRFLKIEKLLKVKKMPWKETNLDILDKFWEKVKKEE